MPLSNHKSKLVMADDGVSAALFSRNGYPLRCGFWRHGLSATPLKNVYIKMKARCYNPKTEGYKNYGGRGITVCEEWCANPAAFFAWALANGYREDLQIDRKDNDEGYSPENCRWTTSLQNQNNRSNNTRIEYNGENLTLAEWSRRTGINQRTLAKRLYRGWTGPEALSFVAHVRTWIRRK